MITFRLDKKAFAKNTFFAHKKTPIDETLNHFGFIKHITKNGLIIADWYENFVKMELTFKPKELSLEYKSIYPYYNNKTVRGNIWKHSYLTLLSKIHKDYGVSKLMVDKVTYKKTPVIKDNVIIVDHKVISSLQIDDLKGFVELYDTRSKEYVIKTATRRFIMKRTSFVLQPQDDFVLLAIRCN